ncbi:MAG: tetratricopeptide repeat protein [Wenzhouxiangella sp.]
MEKPSLYRFENFSFAPSEGRLRRGDEDLILEQKVADLLHAFCRRPGQVLTKTWLMEEIWPGRVVNEDSLSVAVSKLRRVLGDRAAAPKYIRTVTGTGYLWLPRVDRVDAAVESTTTPQTPHPRRKMLSGLALAALLIAAAGAWWTSREPAIEPDVAAAAPTVEAPTGELSALLGQAQQRLGSDSAEDLRQAVADFREVLKEDPDAAAAYLGIAQAKMQLSALDGHLDIELFAEEAHALLDRVLALDPANTEAWLLKGEVYLLADWDIERSEQAFLHALEIDPDNPRSYLPYSELLLMLGEFERAEEVLNELRRTNPASYRFVNMTFVYYMRGELERALAEVKRLIMSEPESRYFQRMMLRIALLLGEDELAFEQLVTLMDNAGIDESQIAQYAGWYRERGMAALFARFLDERLEANIGHYIPPISWARYAIHSGRHEAAFRWLNEAVDERQPPVLLLNVDPIYQPLRNDRRFRALLDRLPPRAGNPVSG